LKETFAPKPFTTDKADRPTWSRELAGLLYSGNTRSLKEHCFGLAVFICFFFLPQSRAERRLDKNRYPVLRNQYIPDQYAQEISTRQIGLRNLEYFLFSNICRTRFFCSFLFLPSDSQRFPSFASRHLLRLSPIRLSTVSPSISRRIRFRRSREHHKHASVTKWTGRQRTRWRKIGGRSRRKSTRRWD